MIKKKILPVFAILLSFFVLSCASKPENNEVELNAEAKEGKNLNLDTSGAVSKAPEIPSAAPKSTVVDKSGKVEVENGILYLKTKPRSGTFNIYVINMEGKKTPVFSDKNEFTTTAFYIQTGKKIYKLISDNAVSTYTEKAFTGAKIHYSIKNTCEAVLQIDTFPSTENSDVDMAKLTFSLTNTGKKANDFAVKAILDTVLGESGSYHFFTRENIPIQNEIAYGTMQNQKWFYSKNGTTTMQIFFYGYDITPPESVYLANYNTLKGNSWEPNMFSFRQFDTVLSYNDSAIEANWANVTLQSGETENIVFYMAFASDGRQAKGEYYLYPQEDEEEISEEKLSAPETKMYLPAENVKPAAKNTETKVSSTKSAPSVQDLSSIPNVKFDVNKVSQNQLTSDYIQNLLDRIAVLESNSASANREEILQLNAELDAILSQLRQY